MNKRPKSLLIMNILIGAKFEHDQTKSVDLTTTTRKSVTDFPTQPHTNIIVPHATLWQGVKMVYLKISKDFFILQMESYNKAITCLCDGPAGIPLQYLRRHSVCQLQEDTPKEQSNWTPLRSGICSESHAKQCSEPTMSSTSRHRIQLLVRDLWKGSLQQMRYFYTPRPQTLRTRVHSEGQERHYTETT